MPKKTVTKNTVKKTTKKKTTKVAKAPKPVERRRPSEERVELIEMDMPLAIFSDFDLVEIKMQKKKWYVKMVVDKILDRSYFTYRMTMQFNEMPYEDDIYEMETELRDTLFAEEKNTRKQLNKRIAEKRQKMESLQNECQTIEFIAHVEEVKYKDRGTQIVCRVPDDVIQPMNNQLSRFDYYEIKLDPLHG